MINKLMKFVQLKNNQDLIFKETVVSRGTIQKLMNLL